jgi:hypothetical protein
VNGTWFLWAVGSESVAVAASSLARVTPGHVLAVLAVVCWAVGMMQFLPAGWAVVFAAMVAAKLRARPTTAHGSAGAGQTARPQSTASTAPGALP